MGTLSSQIQALITYSNEITGANDTRLGDAVRTLCDGYGSGSSGYTYKRPDIMKTVVLMDYNGTLIDSYSLSECRTLTELPTLPNTDRLIFQGWTHTLEEVKALTLPTFVFAQYTTKSGANEIIIRPESSSKCNFRYKQLEGESIRIDWGDGSDIETVDTVMNDAYRYHTYADCTKLYTIKIYSDYTFRFLGTNTAKTIEINCISDWQLINNTSIDTLLYLSMPLNSTIDLSRCTNAGLWTTDNLKCIPIKSYNSLGLASQLQDCYINYGIQPNTTDLNKSCNLSNKHGKRLIVPDCITSLTGHPIISGMGNAIIVFLSTTPPTLESQISLYQYNTLTRIYVPDASLDAYKTATYWSNAASRIFPLSELD